MVGHDGLRATAPVRPGEMSRLLTLRAFTIFALLAAFVIEILARYLSQVANVPGEIHKSISLLALIVLASSGLYLVSSLRNLPVVKWSMVLASVLLLLSQILSLSKEFAITASWPVIGRTSLLGGSAQGLILIGGLILMLATLYFALVETVAIQERLLRERRELSQEVAERKRAEAALSESREQIRRLTAHLESAREEERTRIAREIHDELGQTVTGLRINLGHLEGELKKEDFAARAAAMLDEVSSMKELVGQTMQSARRIITELRPGVLDDLGLQAAVEWQAREFQRRTNIDCELNLDVEDVSLESDTSTALFRIFQEALTNVARHAQASKVSVTLVHDDKQVLLEVGDDGRGIADVRAAEQHSFGLLGIRERVLQGHGEFRVNSTPGEGTRINVQLPLTESGVPEEDGSGLLEAE